MIFGEKSRFAIEVDLLGNVLELGGVYVHFRFWISDEPIGNWDDIVFLASSVSFASEFLSHSAHRRGLNLKEMSAQQAMESLYRRYYIDIRESFKSPDLRSVFHLDSIGMGSTQDTVGIVAYTIDDGREHVVTENLTSGLRLRSVIVPSGTLGSILGEYIEWGKSHLP